MIQDRIEESRTIARESAGDRVRFVAVGLCALVAVLYYLIGLQALEVLDDPGEQTAFGLIAGSAFLLGAVVLAMARKRIIFVLGSVGLLFVIFTYFNLAPDRSPSYELWGIVIRVVQVMLLGALGYLSWHPPTRSRW